MLHNSRNQNQPNKNIPWTEQEDGQKDSEDPRLGEAEGAGTSDRRDDLLPDVPHVRPVLQERAPWVSPEKCSTQGSCASSLEHC